MIEIYTILTALGITSFLCILYNTIFGISIKKIGLGVVRSMGIGSLLLLIHTYAPELLITMSVGVGILSRYQRKDFRTLMTYLLIGLGISYSIEFFSSNSIIIGIITAVLIEEINKSAGISIFKPSVLPYDSILIGILLGSFFGVFEAGRASWIGEIQQIWMRMSSSLSIHTVVTTTFLGVTVLCKGKNHILLFSILGATTIHIGYNYFQGIPYITMILLIVSYSIISYRISRIDRIYI